MYISDHGIIVGRSQEPLQPRKRIVREDTDPLCSLFRILLVNRYHYNLSFRLLYNSFCTRFNMIFERGISLIMILSCVTVDAVNFTQANTSRINGFSIQQHWQYTSSASNSKRNGNQWGHNTNCSTNNNRSNKKKSAKSSHPPKTKHKPAYIGLSIDKIKAVVADEPGLDPLSVQLENFQREVLAYVMPSTNADIAKAIKKLTPTDFTETEYLPKAVAPKKYTTVIASKKSDSDPSVVIKTVEIDQGQKDLLDSINNSTVQSYQAQCDKYHIYMENLFGIMEGNLNQNILSPPNWYNLFWHCGHSGSHCTHSTTSLCVPQRTRELLHHQHIHC